MAEIRWIEETLKWLLNINEYIAEDNPIAAQKVVDEIYERIQILELFPEIGYKYRG